MKIIAHRGNICGRSEFENHPDQIAVALSKDFDVEIDVWALDDKLFLGHDEPQFEINVDFLLKIADCSWIHCKNRHALERLCAFDSLNIFWHQEDDFVLTRTNHIWTYPGKPLGSRSIAVMPPDDSDPNILSAAGICTDFPELFKEKIRVDRND